MAYDCSKCPGYCCTHEIINVTRRDVERLAQRFGLEREVAEQRFTKVVDGTRSLRHRRDEVYKYACRFLDPETRRCTVYEHRPEVCRQYPHGKVCGYYQFLKFERDQQGDAEFVPLQRF